MFKVQQAIQDLAARTRVPPDPSINDAHYRFGATRAVDAQSDALWRRAVTEFIAQFEVGYRLLEDDASRAVYVESLLFRMVGWTRMVRARNTVEYRARAARAAVGDEQWAVDAAGVAQVNGRPLHLYRSADGVSLVASEAMFINLYLNEQYVVRRPEFFFGAREGDVVVDCGGCFGDTALFFASTVGESGRVICFEFVESNLDVLTSNIARNPVLSSRIHVERAPVGSQDGVVVMGCDIGPASRVVAGGSPMALSGNRPVKSYRSRTIDSVCISDLGVDRVDVIKMDIEGAEADALQGAREVIRRWRPRLAISAYHRVDDFFRLPVLIRSIEPRYRFWMDHHTIHEEETVLYAVCDG